MTALAGRLIGCTSDNGAGEGRDSGGATAGQEVSERGGGESGGEHGGAGEGTAGGGAEGAGGEGGSEEGSGANQLAPDETFDMVWSGARLTPDRGEGAGRRNRHHPADAQRAPCGRRPPRLLLALCRHQPRTISAWLAPAGEEEET